MQDQTAYPKKRSLYFAVVNRRSFPFVILLLKLVNGELSVKSQLLKLEAYTCRRPVRAFGGLVQTSGSVM
jgi:hypothetical protein